MIKAGIYHNYNLPLSLNEMLKEYPDFAGETFDYDYILDNLGNLYEADLTVGDSWEKLDTREALTNLRQWQRSDYDTPEDEPAYFAVYKAFYGEFLDKLLTKDDVTFINQRNFEKTLINGEN